MRRVPSLLLRGHPWREVLDLFYSRMAVRVPVHDSDYADHDGAAQSRPDHVISAHQAQKAVVAG